MRRLRTLGVGMLLLALAAALVPGTAHAVPPTVFCVISYGHENPGNCDKHPDLSVPPYRGKIYPTSQPYGYGEKGLLFVEGNATPGSRVTVTATDGSLQFSRTVETALSDDPVTGRRAGDFKADLKVTELGVHQASGGNPFGHSVVTVTAVAVNNLNESSTPKTSEIDKYAVDGDTDGLGNTMDVYPPVLSKLKWPPKHWCHLSNAGMGSGRFPSGFNNFGGDTDGRCSTLQSDGIGAAPDVSWVACLEETSEASGPRSNLPAPLNTPNPFRSEYCRTSTQSAAPKGEAQLSGLAEDDHANAFGHASEIASIVIVIRQGTTVLRTITDFARINSTQGQWAKTLRINDFAPNYPDKPAYSITVTATDATGRTATAAQTGITVYPW